MVLALYLGIASIAFALAAAVMRPSERSMLLVALSFFLSSLCFLFILWSNTRVDISSILDTVNGWFFWRGGADGQLHCPFGNLSRPIREGAPPGAPPVTNVQNPKSPALPPCLKEVQSDSA